MSSITRRRPETDYTCSDLSPTLSLSLSLPPSFAEQHPYAPGLCHSAHARSSSTVVETSSDGIILHNPLYNIFNDSRLIYNPLRGINFHPPSGSLVRDSNFFFSRSLFLPLSLAFSLFDMRFLSFDKRTTKRKLQFENNLSATDCIVRFGTNRILRAPWVPRLKI